MIKKVESADYKILFLALLVSLVWHLFWLSAVKVVSSGESAKAVKFSKVSFLGPILTRVGMEVRAHPAARSKPEKRFLKVIGEEPAYSPTDFIGSDGRRGSIESPPRLNDEKMPYYVNKFIGGSKLEPDFGAD
ncbi:MAG: hypothetical protein NC938_02270 [Candidatus Omnitrophica bacterium]|nr:hypothetical protein [Candidatus Omnitrophota bacterium]MCM8790503.1 hypothetical protein [Candidatus Omnitrophota bacterium]